VRADFYLYEVEPEDLGPDRDALAVTMRSASCARARVVRCVHEPDLRVVDADLSAVAGEGGRIVVAADDVPPGGSPEPGARVVVRDGGLSKAAVVRAVRDDGALVVDVVGDRVRLPES
jgi:hypothetical protein